MRKCSPQDCVLTAIVALSVVGVLVPTVRAANAPEAAIREGDKLLVADGPAPVKQGESTLATVAVGTQLVANKVKGSWVAVTVKKDGQSVSGWVHTKWLKRLSSQAEGGPDTGAKSVDKGEKAKTPAPQDPSAKAGPRPESTVEGGVVEWRGVWLMTCCSISREHTEMISIFRSDKELPGGGYYFGFDDKELPKKYGKVSFRTFKGVRGKLAGQKVVKGAGFPPQDLTVRLLTSVEPIF